MKADLKQFENRGCKALIYCRVSTTRQKTEGSGLESQEHRCRQFAESRGYHVEAVFPDDYSGGGDYMERPGMRAMLTYLDAQKPQPYIVIFDERLIPFLPVSTTCCVPRTDARGVAFSFE